MLTYDEYHNQSFEAGDIDPAVDCLDYLADRFEMNQSQRYWLAFLYGTNYCAPTTFYIYNEFPDYETVDPERLKRWWEANKKNLIFQTDRLRIKTTNAFIPAFLSYRSLVQTDQHRYFSTARNWQETYDKITAIKHFGRFSTFNYLDTLNRLTPVKHAPAFLNMIEAESCRNGICYAIGHPEWIEEPLTQERAATLHKTFVEYLQTKRGNVFQIETTLCAYKKYMKGQRYVGYYIERMRQEIETLQTRIPEGVAWETLWQYRKENYDPLYLQESR